MPCDIARYRKYRHWDTVRRDDRLDPWSMGFLNKGQVPHDWWLVNTTTQTDPDWNWVNDGVVLYPNPVSPRSVPWWWYPRVVGVFTSIVNLFVVGSPVLLYDGGNPYNVRLTIAIQNNDFLGGVSATIGNDLLVTAPTTVRSFTFQEFNRFGDSFPPFGFPLGSWELIPLDRCHQCTPGP